MSKIPLNDLITFQEGMIEEYRRAGGDVSYMKAICAALRKMTKESAHSAHRALAHQIAAAKRQKARIGFVDTAMAQAAYQTLEAHWPAVQIALRARNEELAINPEVER